jgi:hypothetical protein
VGAAGSIAATRKLTTEAAGKPVTASFCFVHATIAA